MGGGFLEVVPYGDIGFDSKSHGHDYVANKYVAKLTKEQALGFSGAFVFDTEATFAELKNIIAGSSSKFWEGDIAVLALLLAWGFVNNQNVYVDQYAGAYFSPPKQSNFTEGMDSVFLMGESGPDTVTGVFLPSNCTLTGIGFFGVGVHPAPFFALSEMDVKRINAIISLVGTGDNINYNTTKYFALALDDFSASVEVGNPKKFVRVTPLAGGVVIGLVMSDWDKDSGLAGMKKILQVETFNPCTGY
jgi:hypothetical protein